jgi:ubiquinone/menaquinone biosynthesis C-methylase UbiE
MEHADHVNLLRRGIPGLGGVWADFGSGAGAFTLALADLIQPTGTIFSIDQNGSALQAQEKQMSRRFPEVRVHYLKANYTHPLELPPLDGIIAANTLHFLQDKDPVVNLLFAYLKPTGRMILVEYNINNGNYAVPYPLPYPAWERLAKRSGFTTTRLLANRPSSFLREIYSALSMKVSSGVDRLSISSPKNAM